MGWKSESRENEDNNSNLKFSFIFFFSPSHSLRDEANCLHCFFLWFQLSKFSDFFFPFSLGNLCVQFNKMKIDGNEMKMFK